eukprot:11997260-Karenia_brevis.AAC.1
MFAMLSQILYKGSLRWKSSELSFMPGSNFQDIGDIGLILPDGKKAVLQHKRQIEVLGIMLDQRGSTEASMEHRLAKAEGAYGLIAHQLKNKRIPVKERLLAWSKGPVASAIYGGGGWHLSSRNLGILRRWENKHVRAFLKFKRLNDDESQMMFNRRTNLLIQ